MLQSIVHRPQRLLLVLVAFVVVLFFTTYLSLSSWGSEQVRTHYESLKSAINRNATHNVPSAVTALAPGAPSRTFMEGVQTVEDLRKYAVRGKDGNLYPPTFVPSEVNKQPRAKAGFIVLVRNSELDDMRASMRDGTCARSADAVEDRFNRKYGYPWIFLNSRCPRSPR